MLTGDLVRVRIEQQRLRPSWVDRDDPKLLERAEELVALFRQALAEQWNRGRIDEAVKAVAGTGIDHKLTRGLAKVLTDRGQFDTRGAVDPVELRRDVFGRAARLGPMARSAGATGRRTAKDLLAEVAAERAIEGDLSRALYSDLQEEQVLVAWEDIEPRDLLDRYNVALVQAALLKAETMTIRLSSPAPKELRALITRLKFHQLMYRIERDDTATAISIDGPESLLKSTTRYGLQLAVFFPILPRLTCAWSLSALLRWGRRRLRKTMRITSEMGLVSATEIRGRWKSQAEEWFEERFPALDSGWTLGPGQPIDLGKQDLIVPDFTFEKRGRVAHLDIVGFWRKPYLQRRLANLPDNVILAVSKKLVADKAAIPKGVLVFGEAISPKDVLERIEKVAR
jgi:predicted nuclease of restriction endonuclease-like RecB superfamily